MPQSEEKSFLQELEANNQKQVDPFDAPIVPEKVVEKKDELPDPEKVEESVKNRQHRRMAEKLQAERETNIALNAKLATLSEVAKFKQEEPDVDIHKMLYGTTAPTDETKANAAMVQKVLEMQLEKADKRLEAKYQQMREAEKQAETKELEALDSIIEDLEDEHSVALTKEQREGYFALMAKMSPKDEDGEVKEYADPDAVWEIYAEKLQASKKDSATADAKSLSSRSMTQSGASTNSTLKDDVMSRFVKEMGW